MFWAQVKLEEFQELVQLQPTNLITCSKFELYVSYSEWLVNNKIELVPALVYPTMLQVQFDYHLLICELFLVFTGAINN